MSVGLEYVRLDLGRLGESIEGEVQKVDSGGPEKWRHGESLQGTSHGDHSQVGGRN